jgi:hypothetical protein
MADKIREITIGYRYIGILTNDAKVLGICPVELNDLLNKNKKSDVSSIARLIFKQIVPEEKRTVNHWKELGQDVLVKEQILLSKSIVHIYISFFE